jgi:hypothetical protein
MNRGVREAPYLPSRVAARIQGTKRLTNTQRQWKDIKQKYLQAAEEDE